MSFKKEISGKEYIKFLLPSIMVMIFISTFSIVDGYFVAKYVGPKALAALNLVLPLNSVIFAVGLMFAAGGGAYASIKLGEKDLKTASKYFSNIVTIGISFGVILSVIAFTFRISLLEFLGVDKELWKYALDYSFYSILAFPILIAKVNCAVLSRAEGSPKIALNLSILGGIANLVLDYIFIVHLDMGIAGAGLGTMLGLLVAVIYGFVYFTSSKSTFKLKFQTIDFKFIRKAMFNGSSEMVSELAIGFTALVFNLLSIKYGGNEGVVAISVMLYVHLLIGNTFQGIAMGTSPLLSYHYGAKNLYSLRKVMNYARNVLLIISPLFVVIIMISKSMLVSMFFKDIGEAYNLAVKGLGVFSVGFLFIGFNMYGSAMYTAFSNGKVSAIISFTKTFIIFSIVSFTLPIFFGIKGVWMSMPVVEIVTMIIVFYLTRDKQLKKYANLDFSILKNTNNKFCCER